MELKIMSLHTFLFIAIACVNGQRPLFPDLPDPRIVIVGPTGAGKSSLANALLGCDPRRNDCMFEICDSMDSCTKDTTYGVGQWLGKGQNFTVIDTPGFSDSDNEGDNLIESMMDFLSHSIEHSDTILLLLKGDMTRFDNALSEMITRMTMMFGTRWWEYVIIGVSFWAYDQDSIDERFCDPAYPHLPCHDETWFKDEINGQIHEKFGTNKNFTFVFSDSWSQTAGPPHYNTDDPQQQEHWEIETAILWDITTTRNNTFDFMTINDFMEENARQQAEIKWLNDVITNNITELQNNFQTLIPAVGSIIAWMPSGPTPGTRPTAIPLGWQRCDGQLISEYSSPFYGLLTPDLNGQALFLRGGSDKDATTVQNDMTRSHKHKINTATSNFKMDHNEDDNTNNPKSSNCYERQGSGCSWETYDIDYSGGEETRPRNMAVVYIMRIF